MDKSRIDHLSRLLLGENIMESNRDESVSGHSAAVPVTEDALQPTEEDSSVESFDQLFQQLCTMKVIVLLPFCTRFFLCLCFFSFKFYSPAKNVQVFKIILNTRIWSFLWIKK